VKSSKNRQMREVIQISTNRHNGLSWHNLAGSGNRNTFEIVKGIVIVTR
jgi:hypothetical protein